MLNPDIPKFRLGLGAPNPEGGISLMRCYGPFWRMAKQERRLEIVEPPGYTGPGEFAFSWDWLAGLDALYLQGPAFKSHAQAAVMARMMEVPVWLDYDDDLTCAPLYNPRAHLYPAAETERTLRMLCHLADVITVSTVELQRRRERMLARAKPGLERNVRVLPGATAVEVLPNGCAWPFWEGPRERRIVWRGGDNHDGDLQEFLPAIREIARQPQYAAWRWCFVGQIPWTIKEAIPEAQLELDSGADPFLYMKILAALSGWVHIVPLRDNGFNRCRSNLAWIEGTCAGSVVLGPDWEEWQRPGTLHYSSPEDFGDCLRGLLHQYEKALHPAVREAQGYLRENLWIDRVNQQRWAILNRLWRQSHPPTDETDQPAAALAAIANE